VSKLRSQALIISYGEETIPVQVRYIDTKRFTVTVDHDLTVRANAPQKATTEEVTARLESRAGWIARQRTYFKQFLPERPAQRFVSGASLWYLGKQYRLKTIDGRGPAKLSGQFLQVPVSDGVACEAKVREWYRDRAKAQFTQRLDACHAATKPILKIGLPPIAVRQMVRRWGSCTAAGKITLNTDLVQVPVHCIDYVIIHEMCHIRVLGHDKAFYRLLAACLPDWERRKARLEVFVI
jgi:predicted metal-dependent hydrolase